MGKIRAAKIKDVLAMMTIRLAVKENRLSRPDIVKKEDYYYYLAEGGKGWVWVEKSVIKGFAFLDLTNSSVWALFVHPDEEGKGIGRALHDHMLDEYFKTTENDLTLTTAPGTRAAHFYKNALWQETGMKGGELVFVMDKTRWESLGKFEI